MFCRQVHGNENARYVAQFEQNVSQLIAGAVLDGEFLETSLVSFENKNVCAAGLNGLAVRLYHGRQKKQLLQQHHRQRDHEEGADFRVVSQHISGVVLFCPTARQEPQAVSLRKAPPPKRLLIFKEEAKSYLS